MIHFSNSQWNVTDYGIEAKPPGSVYEIDGKRLLEITDRGRAGTFYDWPVHMAEKEWVDLSAFNEAFVMALTIHGAKLDGKVDAAMLHASIMHAHDERQQLMEE